MTIGIRIGVDRAENAWSDDETGMAQRLHRSTCSYAKAAAKASYQPLIRTNAMNVVNCESPSTRFAVSPSSETFFFNKFVVRLVQSATTDLKPVTPPSAHELAVAFQAAFDVRTAAV